MRMAFPTTRWTLFAQATLHGDEAGRRALDNMCAAYCKPVIACLLARGMPAEIAEDTVQDFFLKLVSSRAWKQADRAKGKFRTFMLAILSNVMKENLRNGQCLKRGGGIAIGSLDALADEGVEFAEPETADAAVFDREWAKTLLERTMAAVEAELLQNGRPEQVAWLRRFLPGMVAMPSYEEAAAGANLSVPALKAAVHRLRQRFREVLRGEVARTVATPHEIDEELRYLGALLIGTPKEPQPSVSNGKETGA